MEVRRYLQLLRRWWVLLVVTVVVGLALGWATAPSVKASYRSSAEILVSPAGGVSSTTGGTNTGTQASDQLLESYAVLFPTPAAARAAVSTNDLPRSAEEAQAETKVQLIPTTDVLLLVVTDPSPVIARRVANAMAATLVADVSSGPSALPGEVASVAVPAQAAQAASVGTPGRRRRVLEYGALGLVVSVALIVMIDQLAGDIRRPEEMEARLRLPILALLPPDPDAARAPGAD